MRMASERSDVLAAAQGAYVRRVSLWRDYSARERAVVSRIERPLRSVPAVRAYKGIGIYCELKPSWPRRLRAASEGRKLKG